MTENPAPLESGKKIEFPCMMEATRAAIPSLVKSWTRGLKDIKDPFLSVLPVCLQLCRLTTWAPHRIPLGFLSWYQVDGHLASSGILPSHPLFWWFPWNSFFQKSQQIYPCISLALDRLYAHLWPITLVRRMDCTYWLEMIMAQAGERAFSLIQNWTQ